LKTTTTTSTNNNSNTNNVFYKSKYYRFSSHATTIK